MSKMTKETIKCPNCNKFSTVHIWNSINVDIDPDIKGKILNRTAFEFECPYCHEKNNLVYTFLYHDMERQYMIYQVTNNKTEEEFKKDINVNEKYLGMSKGYKYRIVREPNDLIEMIRIFDDELNDIIVFALKTIIINQLTEEELSKLIGIYYDNKNENNINYAIILDDKSFGCSVPFETYHDIESENNIKKPKGFAEINLETFSNYI